MELSTLTPAWDPPDGSSSKGHYMAALRHQHVIIVAQDFPRKWRAHMPSLLWHCWLVIGKNIRPVKNVMRYWRGYLSGARCKWFACGPSDATATRHLLLQ